jgi:phosphatidylserine/phosphatidylglycerophosphate/cardiolipin synthase-like enzyme
MTASGAVDRIVVEPGDRLAAVLELIDAARRRLDLSVFRCDEDQMIAALERAVRRGVQVRALMTGVELRGRSAVASSGMLELT